MKKATLKSILISADTNIKQSMQKLVETGQKILLVVNEYERISATITDGDIRKGIISGLKLTCAVKEIMNKRFVSINASQPDLRNKARELMQQHGIEHIPVIDKKGGVIDVILWIDYLSQEKNTRPKTKFQNPVVIMAGGKGTRLDPFTKMFPKPLIPFGEKPIIECIMERFYQNGYYRFFVVVNYKKEMIKVYFKETEVPFEIEFIEEEEYYGTAGGLTLLKKKLDKTFIVTNCDTILDGDKTDFLRWHEEKDNLITIVGSHKELDVPYGILNMKNGSLDDIDEKPKYDLFVNTGTYVFNPEALNVLADKEYIDMNKFIDKIKYNGSDRVGVYPHWGGWFDIGHWDEYNKSLKQIGWQKA
tara:strand:+ start:12104 stop:13186 length:1083 start_codon:yes stop_codon:yes gene_type:complete